MSNLASLREFCASDLKAVFELIHHTIDASYSKVYEITGHCSADVGESQQLDYWEARKKLGKENNGALERVGGDSCFNR